MTNPSCHHCGHHNGCQTGCQNGCRTGCRNGCGHVPQHHTQSVGPLLSENGFQNGCDGRKHLDGSRCPNDPILHPAVIVPLAIATGGLSCAALGIYRGYTDHKARKAFRNAQLDIGGGSQPTLLEMEYKMLPPGVATHGPSEKDFGADDKHGAVSVNPRPPSYAEVQHQDRK